MRRAAQVRWLCCLWKGGVCWSVKGIGEIESRGVWGKHRKSKAVASRGNSPQLCSAKPLGSAPHRRPPRLSQCRQYPPLRKTPLHAHLSTLASLRSAAYAAPRAHTCCPPSFFPVRLRRTNALIPISRKNFATYFVVFLRFSTSNFVVWRRKTFFRVGLRRNPTNYPDLTDWKLP